MPGMLLGDIVPNFEADSTFGRLKLHDFLWDSWAVLFSHPRDFTPVLPSSRLHSCSPILETSLLFSHPRDFTPVLPSSRLHSCSPILETSLLFSHPRDFTPVCTTELGRAAQLSPEFSRRNVKLIALSVDRLEDHHGWSQDILAYNNAESGSEFPFPIIADAGRDLVETLGMLDPEEKDQAGMPLSARCVFVTGPDKKLKLSILYPATTGRNFDEILRVVDSLQLTAHNRVATPVDWRPGDSVMVPPSIPEQEAVTLFPAGVYTRDLPSGKKYLRYTPQPNPHQE